MTEGGQIVAQRQQNTRLTRNRQPEFSHKFKSDHCFPVGLGHSAFANALVIHKLTVLRRGTRSTIAMNRTGLPRTQASEAGCAPPISAGNLAAPQTPTGSHRISHRIAWKYLNYPTKNIISVMQFPTCFGEL